MLEIIHLSVASFANIFSHSEVYGFLAVGKLLIKSNLLIFVFIFIILEGGLEKVLLCFMSKSVLPIFSSERFLVSSLTFWSLIHFDKHVF